MCWEGARPVVDPRCTPSDVVKVWAALKHKGVNRIGENDLWSYVVATKLELSAAVKRTLWLVDVRAKEFKDSGVA